MKIQKRDFVRGFAGRFWLRFHVSLIVLFAWGCGFITAKALYVNGAGSMMVRYSIALIIVYAAFLAGVRFWIWCTVGASLNARRDDSGRGSSDSGGRLSSSGGRSSGSSSTRGGGGASGGAGASGSFDGRSAAAAGVPAGAAVASAAKHAHGNHPGWLGSVLVATWKPFAVIFAAMLGFAYLAGDHYPQAHTMYDVYRALAGKWIGLH